MRKYKDIISNLNVAKTQMLIDKLGLGYNLIIKYTLNGKFIIQDNFDKTIGSEVFSFHDFMSWLDNNGITKKELKKALEEILHAKI